MSNKNNIGDEIPLADDDDTEEVTDSDMIKLNLSNITGKEKLEKIQQLQQQHQRRRNSDVTNLARPESPSGTIRINHQPQPNCNLFLKIFYIFVKKKTNFFFCN